MIRKIVAFLIFILCISFAYADNCIDRGVTGCTIFTPNMSCSSDYTIYNLTGDVVQTGSMTNVAQGIYNFSINLSEGSYSILLCSGHTSDIEIVSTTEQLDNLTNIGNAVWDINLTERYPEADSDSFLSSKAGQILFQLIRFVEGWIFYR